MSDAAPLPAGHLFVISAPSGAGKTSLVRRLVTSLNDIRVSVSHTTRAQRSGEAHSIDYFFVDAPTFEGMIDAGNFLEHARVFDHCYGTSRTAVYAYLQQGQDVILEIDWQGARQVRKAAVDAISIFILPPSLDELRRRLEERDMDSATVIAARMREAGREMSHYTEYDYTLINDEFEPAAAALGAVIMAARARTAVQSERHGDLLQGLIA